MSFVDKTKTALKEVIESQGEDGAARVVSEALKSGKLRPEDFSIREIWEACTNGADISEAVASTSFPKITGELINSKIISAYDSVEKIGDMLVTTVPSNMQVDIITGFTEVEGPEPVGEGTEYNDSTFGEKYVTAVNKKYGRILDITEEAIYFDKTGQILARANRLGLKAAQYKEQLILTGVQDLNSTVYRPSGSPTALYATANGNIVTSNAFGEEGLEAVRKTISQRKDDSEGNDTDSYIYISDQNAIVLVPSDLELEAWQMANSALTPESAENAANFFKGRFKVLTSPYVTAASSTTWYYGDPKQDFWYMDVWPLQTLTRKPGGGDEWKRDIKASFKVRMYGSVAAIDTKHFYKNTA